MGVRLRGDPCQDRSVTDFRGALAQGVMVLDGGLATRLEARGHDLSDDLWSARLLLDEPEEIRAAHEDFVAAGARVATTSSYQVSYDGLARRGLDRSATDALLRRSVSLARAAVGESGFVAASVGPYGAALADGSEYRGDYGLTVVELRAWHRDRLRVLAGAGVDVLAVETLPCLAEVEAVVAELSGLGVPAWVSLTGDGTRTRMGESLADAFALAASSTDVVAVGVNCCDPAGVSAQVALAAGTGLPVVVYPNSGEAWDAQARAWAGTGGIEPARVGEWVAAGARAVGGCCRVTPSDIEAVAEVVRLSD